MSTPEALRLYATRDHMALGEHYMRHVSAMTGEGLHAKSAIAAELAHRDAEIERLTAERDAAQADAKRCPTCTARAQAAAANAQWHADVKAGRDLVHQYVQERVARDMANFYAAYGLNTNSCGECPLRAAIAAEGKTI